MTVKEFALIAAAIKTYFPRDNILPTENAMELWYEELKDLPYGIANSALRMHVATNKFPPSIADIRENAAKLNPEIQSNEINEMAAWQMVLKAMRNSAYHSEEEFEKLPPIVQRAVVNPRQLRDWAISENVDGTWMNVTQSNFMRTYRAEMAREKERQKLSPDLVRIVRNSDSWKEINPPESRKNIIDKAERREEENVVPMPEQGRARLYELLG